MPKKTKKEKALAKARRIIQNARLQSPTVTPQETQKTSANIQVSPPTFEFRAKSIPAVPKKSDTEDVQEFTAIRKDIIKTVVLAGAAIAFEFIVFLKLGR